MNKLHIIRDTREQLGWSFLEDEIFAGTQEEKLDTGDYSIETLTDKFTIERKRSVGEIANNIVQDRFVREMERLAEIKHSFMVCEFSCRDIYNYPIGSGIPKNKQHFIKVSGKFIMSRMIDYQIKYNVKILFCDTLTMAHQITYSLLKHILYEYYPFDSK